MFFIVKIAAGFMILMTSSVLAITTSGTMASNETWSKTDNIVLTGTVTVTNNVTLTILPGARVTASGRSQNLFITGSGVLSAIGTPADTILFQNIVITYELLTRDALNILKYCTLISPTAQAIEFRNPTEPMEISAVTIDHCHFINGPYTLLYVTSGGAPTITNCTFYNANSGIFLHGASNAVIRNCWISNVSVGIINASIPEFRQTLTVDHVTIYNVSGTRSYAWANGYGIECCNDSGNLYVTNSIIDGVPKTGIRNNSDDTYYTNQPYGWYIMNDYNCFYNAGSLGPTYLTPLGIHSIEADPLLNNPGARDFSLKAGSPCTAAGNDGKDIGYLPAEANAINEPQPRLSDNSRYSRILISASPIQERAIFDAARLNGASLTIVNVQGRVIRELGSGAEQGKIVWDGFDANGQKVKPGIYFYAVGALQNRLMYPLVKVQ